MKQTSFFYNLLLSSHNLSDFSDAVDRIRFDDIPSEFSLQARWFDSCDSAYARDELKNFLLAAIKLKMINDDAKARKLWSVLRAYPENLDSALADMSLVDAWRVDRLTER